MTRASISTYRPVSAGLSHQRDRIVEIALVDEEGNVLLDTLVNPNRRIPVEASRVHGITDQMVRKKKNIYALLPQIAAWWPCSSLRKQNVDILLVLPYQKEIKLRNCLKLSPIRNRSC